ncbi:type II toxin-antitoxin system RelE/ParE family toxin [Steroidobacter sp. S1-65]|uniref:Type II toxin-antitoxin system RelE/ParE family toxin n=1 Tax=Steroidobacter gossypii TaxID=2805490 RepID=A0ABS1X656_9GAMM|nr:type II toxin-antitoxin system RelE/ParE family toxin [Steroidobacter gossypii]MBM0108714.1 type II toxin-antitoxin system RelE/ParE family toxin [Steroidobacter gossypii]
MRLTFHPHVASDIIRIISHYEGLGGPNLAAEFHAELRATFLKALEAPLSYRVQERGLRRINLPRFPYHILFRVVDEDLRVLVVRHHSRRPSLGISRR